MNMFTRNNINTTSNSKLLSQSKKHIYLLSSIILIGLLIIFISNSFASLTPTPTITIPSTTLSYASTEEGSWQITKTASWLSKSKARINIKVDTIQKRKTEYTDIVLVLDISGSMLGEKFANVQTSVNNLINSATKNDNKVALISFNNKATLVNGFTEDTTTLQESVNNLKPTGGANYYQALVKVSELLSSYTKEENRDCVVIFLTDGLPNVDTPNEVSEYNYLKNKYDYLEINGIQYELGNEILDGVKNITDVQYAADKNNLSDYLLKSSTTALSYDNFEITDYINEEYFNLERNSTVSVTSGQARVTNHKLTWNLSDLKTGNDASLTIDINLNSDLVGVGGIYPTHKETKISYKIGQTSTKETSDKTTVLKDKYTVIYNANNPSSCVVSNVPDSSSYFVYDTVTITDTNPVCSGYQFQGWEIANTNVEKTNDNEFTMPEENVTLIAIWKKLSIIKKIDGTVSSVPTLYETIAKKTNGLDTDIDFSAVPTDTNSGVYTKNETANDKYPVYYYRGNVSDNNVLFAGFCWKMVRTTSTGGVKLIYNGVYDDTNKCNNTGENTQISLSEFNTLYATAADVGYMYGTRYDYSSHQLPGANVLTKYSSRSTSYYYASSISYSYSTGTYTLQDASLKSWADNYSSLTGYYTCLSEKTSCTKVYYVIAADSTYQYDISLSSGNTDPDEETIILSENITESAYGTYTLENPITVKKKDWYTNYSTYKNYYMCKGLSTTTCTDKYLITATSNYRITYDDTNNYVYGNDVTWDGSKYTLTDTYKSVNTWSTDRTTLAKKYHYTCLNTTGVCTDVYYIQYFGSSSIIYYLTLSSGKNIEDTKDEMFTNTTDSTIKQAIDTWYSTNMTSYTEKLEDTVFCNDRGLYSGPLAGKDANAGTSYTRFDTYNRIYVDFSPTLSCSNVSRDGFTVSTESGGNGKLTYPVGLLTVDEAILAGTTSKTNTSYYLYSDSQYWLMSPAGFSTSFHACTFNINSYGTLANNRVVGKYGIRPSISLSSGTKTSGGLGTADDPYVIQDY